MNLYQLQAREPIDTIMVESLNALWSSRHGTSPFSLDQGDVRWRAHGLMGAYSHERVSTRARHYLRAYFRNTPVRRRALAQWLLGTLMATDVGLRISGRDAFRVSVDDPGAHTLFIPGNRRFRVLDFETNRAVLAAKMGYGTESISRELELRTELSASFMVPVLESDVANGWLEEPLLKGWALPRAPRSVDQVAAMGWAREQIELWAAPSVEAREAEIYAPELAGRISAHLQRALARFTDLPAPPEGWLDHLAALGAQEPNLQVQLSHGDLQGGNLWVEPDRRTIRVLDWESCQLRIQGYDARVQHLRMREPVGVGARIKEAGESTAASSLALFLLEDWIWYLEEALDVPGSTDPGALATLHHELLVCAQAGALSVPS